ncbi:MAG: hypothetical protein AAFX40_12135 [Cyanobacteria bacterium J06639_1]
MRYVAYPAGFALASLLFATGCGDDISSPSLPGPLPPQVGQVEKQQFLLEDGFALRATNLRLDFVNPKFSNIEVRTGEQGSGRAAAANISSVVRPFGSGPLAWEVGQAIIQIDAFAPNDASLVAAVNLGGETAGITLQSVESGQDSIRVGSLFVSPTASPLLQFRVDRILSNAGDTEATLEGTVTLQAPTLDGVLNTTTGESSSASVAILDTGRFSATFGSIPVSQLPSIGGGITVGNCLITTDPADPDPGQGYTINITVPPPFTGSTEVSGAVSGTDGFTADVSGTIDAATGIASLTPTIPGGGDSVRDTITVSEPAQCVGTVEITF